MYLILVMTLQENQECLCMVLCLAPGGILGYKRDAGGGGGGAPKYFFGSKIFNSCIFLGSNFCQANSSYAIQAKVTTRSESQKGSMYTVLRLHF